MAASFQRQILDAAAAGDAARVRSLLEADPGLAYAREEDGNGLLHLAAIGQWSHQPGHADVVRCLIEAGADVSEQGFEEHLGKAEPLLLASYASPYGSDIVRLLVQAGADVDAPGGKGQTPLNAAAERGHHEVADTLLRCGATMTMHAAAALGRPQDMRALLKEDWDLVHERDDFRRATPLYYAALGDQPAPARMLLDYEANINADTREGNTAMHAAAAVPAERVLGVLIERGGDVNARNHERQTPLHWVIEEWRGEGSEAMLTLISHGADVNAQDSRKQTPLGKALSRNKTHLADILKKHRGRE